MHDRRFAASQAHRLDDPARKVWLSPAEVLEALGLRAGDTVADVGAGTGYFSLPMAQAVAPEGKVYAVDAQAEMLALLIQKVEEAGLVNVEPIHAEAEKTSLPSSSCNLYFLANVWHELDDWGAAVSEARRVLKADGKIAILDSSPKEVRPWLIAWLHPMPWSICGRRVSMRSLMPKPADAPGLFKGRCGHDEAPAQQGFRKYTPQPRRTAEG
jgi:ubiquinone/menaquinone biosynthesis C-methylase UbiE